MVEVLKIIPVSGPLEGRELYFDNPREGIREFNALVGGSCRVQLVDVVEGEYPAIPEPAVGQAGAPRLRFAAGRAGDRLSRLKAWLEEQR